MVAVRRALLSTTALLAALLVASASAQAPTPTAITTPAVTPKSAEDPVAPSASPKPTPSPLTTTINIPQQCNPAVLKIIDAQIQLMCSGTPDPATRVLNDAAVVLEVAVKSPSLTIEPLGAVALNELRIHGGAQGQSSTTSSPNVTISESSLDSLKNISSLSFSHVTFSTPSVVLTIPDSVAYLKIESTNAKDVALNVTSISGLNKVDILENPLTSVPKFLYERKYTNKITTNVTFGNMTAVKLSSTDLEMLRANMINGQTTFDFESCATDKVSNNSRLQVCSDGSGSSSSPAPVGAAPTPATNENTKSSGSSHTTLIAVISAIAVVAVVIGAVLFRRLRNGKSGARSDNSVNLIGKDDASWNGKLSFISSDESLRALRLEQHEVTLSKSLGAGPLWLGELSGAKVVVKRIEAEVSDAYVTKNLMTQAQALAPLKHENVVSLLGVTWLNGTDFALVAEFMDKSNLKQVLSDANWQLDLHTKLRMCADIAQGLAYLHASERSMYVRAFSSRKVLVNSSSECKLNVLDVHPSATKFEAVESFGAGEIAWLAPELLTRSSPQDPRKINMYAFGVVMCEILARAAPYQSLAEEKGNTLSDVEIVQRIRRQEPLAPHENRPEYMRAPQSLRDAVERCLALSPLDRPSASDVIAALEAAKSELASTQLLL